MYTTVYNFKRYVVEWGVRKRLLSRKPVLPQSSRNAVLPSTALSLRVGRGITVVNVPHNITTSLVHLNFDSLKVGIRYSFVI
jgi:hypothetical protein